MYAVYISLQSQQRMHELEQENAVIGSALKKMEADFNEVYLYCMITKITANECTYFPRVNNHQTLTQLITIIIITIILLCILCSFQNLKGVLNRNWLKS